MAIYPLNMAISVTDLKHRLLQIIRQVESSAEPIDVTRRGKLVARIIPPPLVAAQGARPWERQRGSGRLLAAAEESVLADSDFDALR